MSPIARLMKWYINVPLKTALPVLFIVLLLVSTAGCPMNLLFPSTTYTKTEPYKGYTISRTIHESMYGDTEYLSAKKGDIEYAYMEKYYNESGLLEQIYQSYTNQTGERIGGWKNFRTPEKDTLPEFKAMEWLIDKLTALGTGTPTPKSWVVNPEHEGDNTDTGITPAGHQTGITPQAPSQPQYEMEIEYG